MESDGIVGPVSGPCRDVEKSSEALHLESLNSVSAARAQTALVSVEQDRQSKSSVKLQFGGKADISNGQSSTVRQN